MVKLARRPIKIGFALLACAFLLACDLGLNPAAHKFPNVNVHFVNERTGWIVGPRVLRTEDGGKSWKVIRSNSPGTVASESLDNEQRRIQFVDERVGFFLAHRRAIYKTADGGETWTAFNSPAVANENEYLDVISFVSPTTGWVIGKNIYRTDDGALTWSRVSATPRLDHTRTERPLVADGYPPALSVLSERTLVLVRKDGDVHRSEDGGATWQRVWSVNNFLRYSHFINDKAGWIVGSNGFVGRTTDGGLTWEQIKAPTNAELTDAFFLNDKRGWVVGSDAVILHTNDGGTSWSPGYVKPDGFKTYFTGVYFVNENRGWVVGGDPFNDMDLTSMPSNVILESQDGGQTWFQLKL